MVNPEIEEAVKSSSSLPVLRQMFINLSATREGERERERRRGIEKRKSAGFLSMGSKRVLVPPLATACPSTCVIINYTRASMLSYKVNQRKRALS